MDTFDKYAEIDFLMAQAKRKDTLNKYHMLLKSGRVILENYWRWNTHEYHKELVKYLNDLYIVITAEEDVVSVEKIENPTIDSIFIEYMLASRLRGDETDGDSIHDVRLECKWKDYIRKILCKNESYPLCKP